MIKTKKFKKQIKMSSGNETLREVGRLYFLVHRAIETLATLKEKPAKGDDAYADAMVLYNYQNEVVEEEMEKIMDEISIALTGKKRKL